MARREGGEVWAGVDGGGKEEGGEEERGAQQKNKNKYKWAGCGPEVFLGEAT